MKMLPSSPCFNKWRDQFSRHVKKGERGIKIIAPTPYKIKKEQEKLDPLTKVPMLGKEGKVITEEVEIKIPLYKVVSVFDVTQTEDEPLPNLADIKTGILAAKNIILPSCQPVGYKRKTALSFVKSRNEHFV